MSGFYLFLESGAQNVGLNFPVEDNRDCMAKSMESDLGANPSLMENEIPGSSVVRHKNVHPLRPSIQISPSTKRVNSSLNNIMKIEALSGRKGRPPDCNVMKSRNKPIYA